MKRLILGDSFWCLVDQQNISSTFQSLAPIWFTGTEICYPTKKCQVDWPTFWLFDNSIYTGKYFDSAVQCYNKNLWVKTEINYWQRNIILTHWDIKDQIFLVTGVDFMGNSWIYQGAEIVCDLDDLNHYRFRIIFK